MWLPHHPTLRVSGLAIRPRQIGVIRAVLARNGRDLGPQRRNRLGRELLGRQKPFYGPFGKKCNTGLFEQFGDTTAEKQPAHEVRTFGH